MERHRAESSIRPEISAIAFGEPKGANGTWKLPLRSINGDWLESGRSGRKAIWYQPPSWFSIEIKQVRGCDVRLRTMPYGWD
jgi:hypothetical protein